MYNFTNPAGERLFSHCQAFLYLYPVIFPALPDLKEEGQKRKANLSNTF